MRADRFPSLRERGGALLALAQWATSSDLRLQAFLPPSLRPPAEMAFWEVVADYSGATVSDSNGLPIGPTERSLSPGVFSPWLVARNRVCSWHGDEDSRRRTHETHTESRPLSKPLFLFLIARSGTSSRVPPDTRHFLPDTFHPTPDTRRPSLHARAFADGMRR